jgi:hypothetical protein
MLSTGSGVWFTQAGSGFMLSILLKNLLAFAWKRIYNVYYLHNVEGGVKEDYEYFEVLHWRHETQGQYPIEHKARQGHLGAG